MRSSRYEGGIVRSPRHEAGIGEIVAVQLQGGEERALGVTVCSRGQVNDGGVAPPGPLGDSLWGCLAGLGALRLSGCPALGFGVRPPTGVGQDRAVGGRGVLHQHSILVAWRLSGKIWGCGPAPLGGGGRGGALGGLPSGRRVQDLLAEPPFPPALQPALQGVTEAAEQDHKGPHQPEPRKTGEEGVGAL